MIQKLQEKISKLEKELADTKEKLSKLQFFRQYDYIIVEMYKNRCYVYGETEEHFNKIQGNNLRFSKKIRIDLDDDCELINDEMVIINDMRFVDG